MKPRRFYFALVLLVATLAFTQEDANPNTASVSGSLSDSNSSRPISRATLTLKPVGDSGGSALTATSEPDGSFEFRDVPAGQYELAASKAGFLECSYGAKYRGDVFIPISVASGQAVSGLSFSLVPGVVILGRVEDEDGAPMADVVVKALQYKYVNHGKRLEAVDSATTDDHGEYRLHNLLPGRYYVACASRKVRGLKENGRTFEGRYPVTFYPSVSNFEKAVSLSVEAGSEAVTNFMLLATRTYFVRGRVHGGDPGIRIGIELKAKTGLDARTIAVTVDKNNAFEVRGVLPGTYRLVAQGVLSGKPARAGQTITITEADQNDLSLDLGSSAQPVSGFVRIHLSPEARAQIQSSVKLLPAIGTDDEDYDVLPPSSQSIVSPDLTGRFTGAIAERYTHTMFPVVVANGPGSEDLYVYSVRINGQDITNVGFDPTTAGSLDIVLDNDGGKIDGTVFGPDGRPATGATVCVYPDSSRQSRPDLYRVTRADQSGGFVMRGIAPGAYHVLALQEVELPATTDPEFLKQYEHQSKSVWINRRQNVTVQLSEVPEQSTLPTSGG